MRKVFGSIVALAGLDLEVRRGETLALLGPNGAGKTTLMHLLAGITRPDSGTIAVGGDDPTRARVRRGIGIAPQGLAIYPRLTAAENLRFFGQLYGLRGATLAAAVRQGLVLADLENRASDRAGTFSGGMKRRLNLACALIHQPRLLLLDEPTAGVDPQSRHHLFRAIASLQSAGLTLIYSTHLMEEAEQLCERVAIIDHGAVVAVGSTAEVLQHHQSPDLQSLFLSLTGSELRD
ncbi:MAG TPA: ABC transporter ATP-binding protein [Terriglobales bacterium]|nr:ABC transporter ATP-binding protein [Terriglobales bacterium]